jgi:hypothetical protein
MAIEPRPDLAVIDDERRIVTAPGAEGTLARTGYTPIGYYGDPVRSAETFVTVDGRLWAITGDRVLNKMEDMGLVRTPRFSYSMRGPILSFYRLTGKGKKALAQVVRSEGRCKTVSV